MWHSDAPSSTVIVKLAQRLLMRPFLAYVVIEFLRCEFSSKAIN